MPRRHLSRGSDVCGLSFLLSSSRLNPEFNSRLPSDARHLIPD
ncbi:predicted protein [Botrytis cinerea T4]|uniref:Uncharacterized protein n=1 Tax=Botryotinia fuckeliana (strain T4) TaxID=999810 RepID=G2YAI2_BOTF4|nr:predicted protein [Botrytis cinerea T4]